MNHSLEDVENGVEKPLTRKGRIITGGYLIAISLLIVFLMIDGAIQFWKTDIWGKALAIIFLVIALLICGWAISIYREINGSK